MQQNKQYSKTFLILCVFSITCLLISNIITSKIISIFGLAFTAGAILFPFAYILGDIFVEVYGLKKAKTVIWLGFAANLFMVIMFEISILLPAFHAYEHQNEFALILGSTYRILIASFIAYLVGSFSNAMIMEKLKKLTKGRFLPFRTIASTVVGEGLDTIIFICIAFIGVIAFKELMFVMLNVWILKVGIEVVVTPITCMVINKLKKVENVIIEQKNILYPKS